MARYQAQDKDGCAKIYWIGLFSNELLKEIEEPLYVLSSKYIFPFFKTENEFEA